MLAPGGRIEAACTHLSRAEGDLSHAAMDGQSPWSFTVRNLPPFLNFEKIVALGGGFGALCCHKCDISSTHEGGD